MICRVPLSGCFQHSRERAALSQGEGVKDRCFGGFSTGERLIHVSYNKNMMYAAQRGPRLFEGERNTLS